MIEVLLVEDDPEDALLLRDAVRDAGDRYAIHRAERLAEALRALHDRAFDIALVDLHLPDSHGIVTLHRLLELAGETPVIVLTGMEDAALGLAAIEAGAQDHLVKGSFGPAAALRAIQQAIRRQRTQTELRERVKELTALYATTRTLQDDLEPADVAEQVAEHVLLGLERPSASWISVTIDGITVDRNHGSTALAPAIERPILAAGSDRGRVAIGSLEGAPFLEEEETLVAAVAESIGLWLERRDALDGMRRAEEQVRFTLGQLPVALTTIDPRLNITSAAGGAFRTLGIDPSEMVGPIARHHPTEAWLAAAREAVAGRPGSVETRWRGRTLLHHFEPLTDDRAEPEAAVCISLDVTADRERDATIADQRERIVALFENALDAILFTDSEGRILDANPAACELTGRSRDELVGTCDRELTEDDDPDRGRRAWQAFLDAGEMAGEWRIERPDGTVVDTEYRAVADITPGVHLSIVRDVTARRAVEEALRTSEERYRSLAEGMRDVVYRLRFLPEPTLAYINPAAEEVTGFPPAAYHRDPDLFRSRIHPADLVPWDVAVEQVRGDASGEVHTSVVRFRHADGHWIWLELRRAGIFEDGELVGLQGVIHDVTERQRAAQARERANEALRTALENERRAMEDLRAVESLKASFLQSVSHELRTPLTSILGFSRLLAQHADEIGPEKVRDLHEGLLRNAERLERLLSDLLDVDTFGRGVVQVETSETDLVALASDIIAEIDLADRACRVVGGDVIANVDAPKLRRILGNLLDNAVKHTPPGTSIEVRVEEGRAGVHLTVEDDGPGVPAELHGAIFEPFRQGPRVLDDPSPGAGLGLAIVARVAGMTGGRAWVEDRAGGGARFHVRLPYQDVGRRLARPGSGVEPDELVPADEHEVAFHDAVAARTDRIADLVTRAVAEDSVAVTFLTPASREGLESALRVVGIEPSALVEQGSLVLADAATTIERISGPGGIDPDRFGAHIGSLLEPAGRGRRRLRIYNEMGASLLGSAGSPAVLDLELLWNDIARTHPHTLLCSYATDGARDVPRGVVDRIVEHHTRVVPTVAYTRLRSSTPGELNAS